jgi:hypothetical protein
MADSVTNPATRESQIAALPRAFRKYFDLAMGSEFSTALS